MAVALKPLHPGRLLQHFSGPNSGDRRKGEYAEAVLNIGLKYPFFAESFPKAHLSRVTIVGMLFVIAASNEAPPSSGKDSSCRFGSFHRD